MRLFPAHPFGRVHTRLGPIGTAVTLAVIVCGGAMPSRADDAESPADLGLAADRLFRTSGCAIVNLDLGKRAETVRKPDAAGAEAIAAWSMNVRLPIDGREVTLELAPYSTRSAIYRVLCEREDGTRVEVAPGPVSTLRGTIAELPDAVVAGGVTADGLYAGIVLGDGRRFWVEPIEGRVEGARRGMHAIYVGGKTTPWPAAVCTTPEGATVKPDGGRQPGPSGTGTSPTVSDRGPGGLRFIAQMAIDVENQFFRNYGNVGAAEARVNLVINVTNLQYEREVRITHQITTIVVHQSQNYLPTSPLHNMREQFQEYWNANYPNIVRDLAIQFDAQGLGGQAAPGGGVCDLPNAYAGVGMMGFPGLSYSCDVVAHEAGHLWGACHCPCEMPPYTMNWEITEANRFLFSPASTNETDAGCGYHAGSVSQIIAHRDAVACLTTDTFGVPIRNDACAGAVPIEPKIWGFNTYGATTDGPATASCQSLTGDIWYRYTPTCTGTTVISTCGSDFDTGIVVYRGSCGALTEVICGDDTFACNEFHASRVEFDTVLGTTYLVRIGGHGGETGQGMIQLDELYSCSPRNDLCTRSIEIRNGEPRTFSTVGATTDGFAEGLACNNAGDTQLSNDIWFYYITPCAGTHRVSLCGSSFDTKLAAYAFCPSNAFMALACNDDSGPSCSGLASSLDVVQDAGLLLVFRVGGYLGATGAGSIRVDSLSCPRPPNDDCANAIQAVLNGTYSQPLFGATNDGSASCGLSAINRDIWYSFVAPCNGRLEALTCGSNDQGGAAVDTGVDTVLSIHTSCPGGIFGGGTEVPGGCNDDALGSECVSLGYDSGLVRDSAAYANMYAGQRVLIRLSHYGSTPPPLSLTRFFVFFRPQSDACADAIPVGEGVFPFCTNGATNTTFDNACASRSDIWYRYTASCTGTARVSLCGSSFDTQLAVYAGQVCPPIPTSPLICNLDNGPSCPGLQSSLDVDVVAGSEYLVRIGGYFGAQGSGSLQISCEPSPGACCIASAVCAILTLDDCNLAGGTFTGGATDCGDPGNPTSCCPANINQNGGLTVQDIFDFLAAFFSGDPIADFNQSGDITVQDIFDFLNGYFTGCG